MKRYSRTEIIEQFGKVNAEGGPVIIAGAGIGLSGKFSEISGADMVLISADSYVRMDGYNSVVSLIPANNNNEIVCEIIRRINALIKEVPIAVGVCAFTPNFDPLQLLKKLSFFGASAVVNVPSISYYDGKIRKELEYAGYGFEKEVSFMQMASAEGLYTAAVVTDPSEAVQMVNAGVDAIICDLGFTVGGVLGSDPAIAVTLDEGIETIKAMCEAIRDLANQPLILAHGGPINCKEAMQKVLAETGVSGFYGGAAIDRIPIENPLTNEVRGFKDIEIR